MKLRTIERGREYMGLHEGGCVSRSNVAPTGQWRVTGAVTLNNFGHVVRHWSLNDILTRPNEIPWKHKNGKQKTHICDLDHGTNRTWMSPTHRVF